MGTRIKDIAATATSAAVDDYLELDGVTNGSRKIPASAVATLTDAQALTNKTYNGNTWTAGTGVLTIAAAKTLTVSNTLTLAGTDGTTMTFPSTSATIARTDAANSFSGTQTFGGTISVAATNSLSWQGGTNLTVSRRSNGKGTTWATTDANDYTLSIFRNSIPSAGNGISALEFEGLDAAGSSVAYAQFAVSSPTVTAGASSGQVDFGIQKAGTFTPQWKYAPGLSRFYNSYTAETVYESLDIDWNANLGRIYTSQSGGGTARDLQLGAGGSLYWQLSSSTGAFFPTTTNVTDIGSTSKLVQKAYIGTRLVLGNATSEAGFIHARDSNGAMVQLNSDLTTAATAVNTGAWKSANWGFSANSGGASFLGGLLGVNLSSTGEAAKIGDGTNTDHYVTLRSGTANAVGYTAAYALLQGSSGKGVYLKTGTSAWNTGGTDVFAAPADGDLAIAPAGTNRNITLNPTGSATVIIATNGSGQVGLSLTAASTSTTQNNGGAPILKLQNTSNTDGNMSGVFFYDSGGNANSGILGYHTSHSAHTGILAFGTRNAGTFAEGFRLTNAGNLLVGTTSDMSGSGGMKVASLISSSRDASSGASFSNTTANSIADNATITVGSVQAGLVIVSDNTATGKTAVFAFENSGAASTLISGDTSKFSNTAGTSSKINVYVTGNALTIQNKTGSTISDLRAVVVQCT
jgi:hypothetical protein